MNFRRARRYLFPVIGAGLGYLYSRVMACTGNT